ncbi:ANTAR domain-containing protein [Massilia sp. R2A-15]|uniref:ANTAR domain-containing response regulator n=1 Tax=Massilia sp. R2A-15 TaxID=3064278 RepID=UPI00273680FC|nr:ANTAR domain-containing protein [Massilia sp. R2A-15]WLI87975.1 ANTAR domain-containing protein [Massilia sp. R2A-15]
MNPPLRIVVATSVAHPGEADDAALAAQLRRSAALRIGLLEAGYDLVAALPADMYLPERIAQLQPDLIIIDAESDARDVLEHIVIASRDERRPIVMFTEDAAPASMEAAMAAGVSAYIVAGLQAERVQPVLHVAMARFRQEQKLLDELADTRHKLAERKVIERAKGVLMASQRLSEDQAYQKLRSMAMNKKMKLADIAQRILDVEDLLG